MEPAARSFGQVAIDVIGPFPPPVNGLANANDALRAALVGRGYRVRTLNMSPLSGYGPVGHHASRLGAVVRTASLLAAARPAVVCMSIDGGAGLAYQIVLAVLLRAQGVPISMHHHSFAYIGHRSGLMRSLLRSGPRRQLHVFLCTEMKAQFEAMYSSDLPAGYTAFVLPNDFMIAPRGEQARTPGQRRAQGLVIGMLSNLSRDKGADTFLELFERLAKRLPQSRAILAGPVEEVQLRHEIAEAARRSNRFEYRGQIYGEAKGTFYDDIDVFIFPTRYRNEAQPLVLLEALAHGRPFAATALGCIACDHERTESLVVARADNFVEEATSWLCELAEVRGLLQHHAALAHERGAMRRQASITALDRLMDLLVQLPTSSGSRRPALAGASG